MSTESCIKKGLLFFTTAANFGVNFFIYFLKPFTLIGCNAFNMFKVFCITQDAALMLQQTITRVTNFNPLGLTKTLG